MAKTEEMIVKFDARSLRAIKDLTKALRDLGRSTPKSSDGVQRLAEPARTEYIYSGEGSPLEEGEYVAPATLGEQLRRVMSVELDS